MPDFTFSATINAAPEAIFDLLQDIAHYDRWLPTSNLYVGVIDISDTPIKLGTTYIDQGKSTRMQGKIIAYEPPKHLGFQQTQKLLGGELTVTAVYHLTPVSAGTQLTRETTVQTTGLLRLLRFYLLRTIKPENERTLAILQAHFEKTG
jgi:uncharacterized protein YndB with AHSA1/START domain